MYSEKRWAALAISFVAPLPFAAERVASSLGLLPHLYSQNTQCPRSLGLRIEPI